MRGRTNTTGSVTSKAATSESKRTGGHGKQNSSTTGISSEATSFNVGMNSQGSSHTKSSKRITVVDGIFQ
jgi:hypothetical protein